MTTTASKGGLRAAAAERRNKHAQRTPLPPRGEPELIELPPNAKKYGEMNTAQLRSLLKRDFGQMASVKATKGQLLEAILKHERKEREQKEARPIGLGWDDQHGGEPRRSKPKPASPAEEGGKSIAKALAIATFASEHGWEASLNPLEGDAAELTLTRGIETLWVAWSGGTLTTTPMPTYTVADRTIKLRNASAVKQYAARAPEEGSREVERVAANKLFKPRATSESGARMVRLPFDPATATEAEIIAALAGRAVKWTNRHREVAETAIVGKDPRKLYFTQHAGERIFNFICPLAGHRAFRLSALLKVGKAKITKGQAASALEVE